MATGANALITWTYAQAKIAYEDTEQTLVEGLIDTASAMAAKYCKRVLKAQEITEVLDGTGRRSLNLPTYPVKTFTSLHIDMLREFGSDMLIASDHYYVDSTAGILFYNGVFPRAARCVQVVLTGGYSDEEGYTAIPDDLKIGVLELVDYLYNRLKGRALGIRAVQNPTGIVTQFETYMPYSVRMILNNYRDDRL